ncbi:EamA family transporter [Alicyclobacillus cycloheptanicus]|jgi:drug/metabolite transporter (DMT)-like permease|uniref:Drug/metabolite transporter (DMT)-like permease n=1 Tax=Alicyclobacillus cycloheptanicus TaxID=1457 RepID=A0ABT9XIH8_9BACL|nr:EamA family transporter [Alicyclobacillus cycloheptanicus]MDQ0190095.1 drug/metabolite transporter (DMT)-like permease [Alicyclobacillus cycloheptanicus]WDM02069.1 EamA family transporter [Alicyclobacillus cycloheptanicus]
MGSILNYVLIAVNILLLVAGQTLWKTGVAKLSFTHWTSAFTALFSPLIFAGIVLYALATVVWIYLLSKLPISLLYPLQSLAYVATVFIAIFVFHEHVSVWRWAGVVVILFGVALIVK